MTSSFSSPQRIAILGANGQIGRVLFGTLRNCFPQAEILGCVRRQRLHFEGVSGDTRQRSIVFDPLESDWKILEKTDVVVNCIGAIDERGGSFERAHILPVLALLDNRARIGNPRIIQVSALGASPTSHSAFMRTKAFAEQLVLGQPGTYVIRPSIVCTTGTMLVMAIKRLKKLFAFTGGRVPFPAPFLQTKIQPVLPADLADVVCALAKRGGEMRKVDVAGAEEITLEQLLCLAKLKPLAVPQKFSGLLWGVARHLPPGLLTDEQYRLLGENNVADIREMEMLLGRKAESSLPFWEKSLR
jgi:uncharacterized protein YbjT (DUF2867 family)